MVFGSAFSSSAEEHRCNVRLRAHIDHQELLVGELKRVLTGQVKSDRAFANSTLPQISNQRERQAGGTLLFQTT